jgi:hypothetical protein
MVSVATSSHLSRCERESEREITSRSRAGRSRQLRGCTDTTTVVLESQPTTGMMPSPPVAVGLDTVLLAARQLLNNPPPPRVSPSAAEQWRHDVNQLVIAAINTPHREGWCQPSPQQSHFLSAAHAPSVVRRPRGCHVRTHRCITAHRWPATGRRTSGRRSTAIEVGRTVAPPSSATVRGVETSRAVTSKETSTYMHQRLRAKLHMHLSPLAPREFRGGAWRWPHTCVWWSVHPSSGPTCQRSTTGWSTLPSFCRSTPPPSSWQARMRLSWPTTSL